MSPPDGRPEDRLRESPALDLPHGAKPFRRRPVRGTGVETLVEHLGPNQIGPHCHSHWLALVMPPGAAIEVTWREGAGKRLRRRLVGGDVWLLPPGWTHSMAWREPADIIMLYIEDAKVRRFFPQLAPVSSAVPLTEYAAAVTAVAELCRDLRQFAAMPNGPTDWEVAALGSHLAVLLLRAHLQLTDGVFRPPSPLLGRIMDELNHHLAGHAHERVPMADIARRLGLSDRHLRRLFHTAKGVSPQDWVMVAKARRAAHLLLDGASVKETVDAAGFTSESHLHRVMFRLYAISPAAFRKQAQAAHAPGRA